MSPRIPQYRGNSIERTQGYGSNRADVTRTNERGGNSTTRTQTHTQQANGRTRTDVTGRRTTPRERNAEAKGSVDFHNQERTHAGGATLAKREKRIGDVSLKGEVTGPTIKSTSSGKVQVSKDGLSIEASLKIDATALAATGEASRTLTINQNINGKNHRFDVKVNLKGEGTIGADGELKLKLNLKPTKLKESGVSVEAAGFAGAKTSLTGSISVAMNHRELANVGGKMEIGIGAGAGGSFQLGLTSFKASGKVYGGPGGGFELAGSLKASNIVNAARQIAQRTN